MKSKQSLVEEVAELKVKFEKIKKDTEEFIASAKHLSDSGVREAKGFIDLAKQNWQDLIANFGSSTLAQFFMKVKPVVGKKTPSKKKKVVKKKRPRLSRY